MKTLLRQSCRSVLPLVLGAACVSAPAAGGSLDGMGLPAHPALVLLPSWDDSNPPVWAKDFESTLIQDLTHSRAFRMLRPGRAGKEADGSLLKHLRGAGADLLLRIMARPSARGKLMVESECIALGAQSELMKKVFIGELKAGHRFAHRLADFLVGKVTGIPGCADSSFIFARQTGPGIKEIFGKDRDGRNLRQLTKFGGLSTCPALSPDGKLALVTYKGGPPEIWGQTQAVGPFKRLHPRDQISGTGISGLAWAPDGKRLAFVQGNRKGDSEIFLLDPQTQKTTRLAAGGHVNRGPSWSPDGSQIAFLSDRAGSIQVFVMGTDGARLRQVTTDPAPKSCVAWSPVEDRLACVERMDGWSDLCTLAPDGTAMKTVRLGADLVETISWAPDGRCLALGFRLGQEAQLRIVDQEGAILELPGAPVGGQGHQWIRSRAAAAPTHLPR